MAVYYKFKSAKDFDSVPMAGPFISASILKEQIFESKQLGLGTDFDLVITNAQTNEEYLDEMLIPRNTSVLVRRVPGLPQLPIITEQGPKVGNKAVETEPANGSLPAVDTSSMNNPEASDWDDFGNDLYSIPDQVPIRSNNLIPAAPPTNRNDVDSKIRALIHTPGLVWRRQGSDFGATTRFGRGMARGMGAGRGFGFEWKAPPEGYVCHRCKVPGHFIQHCPTNGDPKYDFQRVKKPTGIPKSMLIVNSQGSYAMPNGSAAVLKPNEAAFEKEIEGLPSTSSVGDPPPGIRCPLCKQVLKDAVLTSKCCFKSFCDKCIRDYIISKSMCVCGTTDVLADDLLPIMTLRETINGIMESGNCNSVNTGISSQAQVNESMGEQKVSPVNEGTTNIQETADDKDAVSAPEQIPEQVRDPKAAYVVKATHEPIRVNEPASQGISQQVEEEMQQTLVPPVAGKKKKSKKVHMPINELQWKTPDDLGAENHMMPMGPLPGYNSYWNDRQPCMDGFMAPYAGRMQMMSYGLSPLDTAVPSGLSHDPFGMEGYMMPVNPCLRDAADFSLGGVNVPAPVMSREEFDARKVDLRRKHENERQRERYFSIDQEFGKSGDYEWHHHHRHLSKLSPKIPPTIPADHRLKTVDNFSSKRIHYNKEVSTNGEYEYERHHHHRHSHRSERFRELPHSTADDPKPKKGISLSCKSNLANKEAYESGKYEYGYEHKEAQEGGKYEYQRQHHHCSTVADCKSKKANNFCQKSFISNKDASKYEHEQHHHYQSECSTKMTPSIAIDPKPKMANIFPHYSIHAKKEASKKRRVTFSSSLETTMATGKRCGV